MSFVHGKNTEVWLDAVDLSAYLNSADLGVDVDSGDTSTFTSDWKSAIAGQAGATVELGGLYDPTLATIKDLLPASASLLTIGPGGLQAVGDAARLVQVENTAYKESAPVGGVVAISWAVLATDPVGFGVLLHPLAEETATGNESSHAGPVGGTTTGAICHLHVVDTDDDLDVLVEHSTNDSDWSTLATFTTAAGATSERITVTGTVNRYLRASWTMAGVSSTFGVSVART